MATECTPHPRSRQHLEHFIQFAGHTTTVNGLSSSTVTAYIAQLEQDKYTAATIRRRIVTLRLFCDFWTQKGELKESPFWRTPYESKGVTDNVSFLSANVTSRSSSDISSN